MKTRVAIVGGGPGGAATAIFLRRAGIACTIVERDPFPRFHIGESMTADCGKVVRMLGLTDAMSTLDAPIKYGVYVYGPTGKSSFWVPIVDRSPDGETIETTAWQVRRSAFDKLVLDRAIDDGAELIRGTAVSGSMRADGSIRSIQVRTHDGERVEIEPEIVVDASGQGSFLSRARILGKKERGRYDNQVAVFSHVHGARRDPGPAGGNTLIFYRQKHHWAWFIPIDSRTVSIGAVVPSSYLSEAGTDLRQFYLRELETLNPELSRRVRDNIELCEEIHTASNYSYEISEFVGANYLCVGDSHRFIDPIFSFGLHFALNEAHRAADTIIAALRGAPQEVAAHLRRYQEVCSRGMDVIQDLIDAFWSEPLAFAFFAHSRYVEDFQHLFAGKVYFDEEPRGLQALRSLLAATSAGVDRSAPGAGS